MNHKTVIEAKLLAKRFITAAIELEFAIQRSEYQTLIEGEMHTFHGACPKESGHLRRVSLDLTRTLAQMRKP